MYNYFNRDQIVLFFFCCCCQYLVREGGGSQIPTLSWYLNGTCINFSNFLPHVSLTVQSFCYILIFFPCRWPFIPITLLTPWQTVTSTSEWIYNFLMQLLYIFDGIINLWYTWIIWGFWVTDRLPLPYVTTLPQDRSKCKCWLRGTYLYFL